MKTKMFSRYVLLGLCWVFHFEVTSTNPVRKIVTVHRGDIDEVENNGCIASVCGNSGLTCSGNGCCLCQCTYDTPNYIVSQGLECFSNNGIGKNSSCEYTINQPSKPIPALDLTTVINGSRSFFTIYSSKPKTVVTCNHGISTLWYYLDKDGDWKQGDQLDVFSIRYEHITIGSPRIRLTDLEWNKKLDARYGGYIIKVSLRCKNRIIGCVMVKSRGTKQYDMTKVPTTSTEAPARPTTIFRDNSTTNYTKENTQTGGKNTRDSEGQKQGDAGNKDKRSGGSAHAALAPTLGVVGALLLVSALCVAVTLYRRRRQRDKNEKPWKNPDTDSVANLGEYAEPIYAEVDKGIGDFDNPVYSDPALDQETRKSTHLGPLPGIPGTETAYQPLNNFTRNHEDTDIKDYDNPIDEVPPSEDYDNPPVGQTDTDKGTSDYDNPPNQGDQENSSNYDNPPNQGDQENSRNYDNPPNQGAQENSSNYDYPSPKESVPNTADQNNDSSVSTQF